MNDDEWWYKCIRHCLSHFSQDYLPACTLWSLDKLLLSVPQIVLASVLLITMLLVNCIAIACIVLHALCFGKVNSRCPLVKAFSIGIPSMWNSLSHKCRPNVSELLSIVLKLNSLTLPIVNVNTQPSLCHYVVPLIRFRNMALYKCVLTDWLIVWLIDRLMMCLLFNV